MATPLVMSSSQTVNQIETRKQWSNISHSYRAKKLFFCRRIYSFSLFIFLEPVGKSILLSPALGRALEFLQGRIWCYQPNTTVIE